MSKVLVVDDEPRYRDHVSQALSRDGHEVRTAASGRDAICVGSRFRPEVLVSDWMLKNHVHGLHVSEVLRTVTPELQTILITGFASLDLRNTASRHRVSRFIEKPFELADLRQAVRAVGSTTPASRRQTPIAVVEADRRNGSIRFANRRARKLFAMTDAGGGAENLSDLFDIGLFEPITAATRQWVSVPPRSAAHEFWHIRSKEYADGQAWLIIIVPEDEEYQRGHPIVRMLLGLDPSGYFRWPLQGRVLIVDNNELVRRAVVTQIEYAGGNCHTAETPGTALRTFERDSGIEVVVLDHDQPGGNVPALVKQLRAIRPDVRIVGTSASDRSIEFERMGVREFLLKPWIIKDLINLLLGRIGDCVSCGLPLPLRRPKPGEAPTHWMCAGCGGRYSAVLDKDFPEDVIRHVRPAEDTQS